jgi:hypothetical protein
MNDLNFNQNEPVKPVDTANSNIADSFKTENTGTKTELHEETGFSTINILLIILFLIFCSWGGYQLYKIYSLNGQIEQNNTELETLRQSNLTDQTEVRNSVKANFLAQKKETQIFWTNVLFNIESNIPAPNNIQINSIAGNEEGVVNLSINTTAASSDPFTDTANLITVFKSKPFFDDIFIPSINSSITNSGEGQLTYSLRLNYQKEENENQAKDSSEFSQVETAQPSAADPAVIDELRQRLETTNNEPN